jgi:hypothetical protein
MDLTNAVNYKSPDLSLQDKIMSGVLWSHYCGSPLKGMATWTVDEGCSREIGTKHYFDKGIGITSTPGTDAVNGAVDRLRLNFDRDYIERCQGYNAILKVDEKDFRRYCDRTADLQNATVEGVRRWIDQQVIPFQLAKLVASADKCNIEGSFEKPILIDSEYTEYQPPAQAGAIRSALLYTRLLKRLRKTDLMCSPAQLGMLSGVDFEAALANEEASMGCEATCANGDLLHSSMLKGSKTMYEASNWMPSAGVNSLGQEVFYVVLFDKSEVWAPHDTITMKWHEHEFHRTLAIEGTYGFGVKRPKSLAVALVTFTQ